MDAVIDRIVFVDVDDASALLGVLEGISSARGCSAVGNITPRPSLKYSQILEWAAQAESGHLVKDGMRMEQRRRNNLILR